MAEQLLDLIIKRLDRIEEKQDRTSEQTTKTNGRVTRLEQGYDTLCDDVNSLNSVKDETKGDVCLCGPSEVGYIYILHVFVLIEDT